MEEKIISREKMQSELKYYCKILGIPVSELSVKLDLSRQGLHTKLSGDCAFTERDYLAILYILKRDYYDNPYTYKILHGQVEEEVAMMKKFDTNKRYQYGVNHERENTSEE